MAYKGKKSGMSGKVWGKLTAGKQETREICQLES